MVKTSLLFPPADMDRGTHGCTMRAAAHRPSGRQEVVSKSRFVTKSTRVEEHVQRGTHCRANLACRSTVVLRGLVVVSAMLSLARAGEVPADNWEIWGTRYPTGDPARDKLLAEGRLRNAMKTGDFQDFVGVVSSSIDLDVNAADSDGRTGLHYAAIEGHCGDFNRTKVPWVHGGGSSYPWSQSFAFVRGEDMFDTCFLERAMMYLETNGYPVFNVKARDRSGQTPLHEAALNGHLMTVRWFKEKNAFTPDFSDLDDDGAVLDDGFVRAKKLHREWSFGWTMMNWAALNARSAIRRTRILGDLQKASENPENFAPSVTRGMTVMDYAVMSGAADVVEYILTSQVAGTINLVRAKSNWNEEPIHKAATLGHENVFQVLLDEVGCQALGLKAEGGEVPVLNAAGGGHSQILQLAKDQCPDEFTTNSRTNTLLNVNPANVRYAWAGETPCQVSSSITQYILDFVQTCPEGQCSGHFRSRCSHDGTTFCYRDSDCQRLRADSVCDLESMRGLESLDMASHWEACNLLCGVSAATLCAGNPSSSSI